jgi:hypothetical protein
MQELLPDEIAVPHPPKDELVLAINAPRISEPLAAYGAAIAKVGSGDNGEREQAQNGSFHWLVSLTLTRTLPKPINSCT